MELPQDDLARVEQQTLQELTASLQLSIDFLWDEIQEKRLSEDDIEDLMTIAFNALAIAHKLKAS